MLILDNICYQHLTRMLHQEGSEWSKKYDFCSWKMSLKFRDFTLLFKINDTHGASIRVDSAKMDPKIWTILTG